MSKAYDATITRESPFGMFFITPISEAARKWVEDNVSTEPYQWVGEAFVLDDSRMAYDIYQGMLAEGFAVDAN